MLRARPALVVLLVLAAACSGPVPGPPRAPQAALRALPGDIRTLPDAPEAVRQAVSDELGGLLLDAYTRGFLPPRQPPGEGSPVPIPVASSPLQDLFTEQSRAALGAGVDAFTPGDVTVRRGTVSYSGIVTLDDQVPASALLIVDLTATGHVVTEGRETAMRLRQTGELLCLRTDSGWRVAGFDVQLTLQREAPAPASVSTAAWMPSELGSA